ncbi:MAG: hypothetical protein H0Z34_06735 [Brevibacillus sp.]|nr:hypothetical protein [Brevibacillus sp.]
MNGNKQSVCTDCQGQGYLELLLGGTERCPRCEGTGASGEQPAAARRTEAIH